MPIKQLALVVMLMPIKALASPAISGASWSGPLSKGTTIVISGSGFGGHTDQNTSAPFLVTVWEDLEAEGIVRAHNGFNNPTDYSARGPERIVGAPCRTGSSYCARGYSQSTSHTFTNIWNSQVTSRRSYQLARNARGQKIVFQSGWYFFPVGFTEAINHQTGDGDQSKFMMMSPPDDQPKTYFSVTASPSNGTWVRLNTEEGVGGLNLDSLQGLVGEGSWARFDMYVDLSKPEGQRVHRWYVNGKLVRDGIYHPPGDAECAANPENRGCVEEFNKFGWLSYQFQGADPPHDWPQYVDDVYLDFTQARVELSDQSTWSTSSQHHVELQIPTRWSDEQVEVTLNPGSFTSGVAYLYVVDSEGRVNPEGYPISLPDAGSDAGGDPDGHPDDARVSRDATPVTDSAVDADAGADDDGAIDDPDAASPADSTTHADARTSDRSAEDQDARRATDSAPVAPEVVSAGGCRGSPWPAGLWFTLAGSLWLLRRRRRRCAARRWSPLSPSGTADNHPGRRE